ncbi:MAG: outer membrane beta-barrel protein [Pseudomonadota bacterium]
MKMKLVCAMVSGLLVAPWAHAEEALKSEGGIISHAAHQLSGGIAAGYYKTTNTGSDDTDNFQVSDVLLQFSRAASSQGVGYTLGFGSLAAISVLDGGVNNSTTYADFGVQYGWVSVVPVDGLTIDAGKLATNVGYEVTPSLTNPHMTLAALWNGQPAYYPGLRVSYAIGDVTVFGEVSDDTVTVNGTTATAANSIGVKGSAAGIDYVASYYNYSGAKNIVDVIASTKLGEIPVAINLDYHMLDDAAKVSGNDDNAYGVALYAKPSFGAVSVPVRVEYMNDGTSGIYGVDTGYTLTVTPTYTFPDNSFVRAEVSYVTTDNEIFSDKNGAPEDTKTSFGVQAGVLF